MEKNIEDQKIESETWHFVWWKNESRFAAAFPNKDDAFTYANHMCYPGDWKIISKKIKE